VIRQFGRKFDADDGAGEPPVARQGRDQGAGATANVQNAASDREAPGINEPFGIGAQSMAGDVLEVLSCVVSDDGSVRHG
jgi:hypothetical protein